MTAYSDAAETRRLPRGWAHFVLQFAIWIGFYAAYQVARGAADQSAERAFENGAWIIDFQRSLGSMMELTFQRAVESSSLLVQATSCTYWLSQFAVVGIALLWIYFRAHERFFRFRNTLIVANLIGLVGYVHAADGAAAHVPAGRVHGHARRARLGHAQLERRQLRREPVCGDAEPALGGRADRRHRDGRWPSSTPGRRCSGSRGRPGSGSA